MNIDDILSSFPWGISTERTLSFQWNSDHRLWFSVVATLGTIFRLKSISQSTEIVHFAKFRFPILFRFVPFRFAKHRFPISFRKIQIFHFVSFHFVSPHFVSQSTVSPSWVHLKHENEKSATKKKITAQMTLEWCTVNVHGSLDGILKRLCESSLAVVRSSTVWKTKLTQWIQNQQHSL